MHRIKKQARKHAWYNDGGGETNLNPFGKHGVRQTLSHSESEDPELGLSVPRPLNQRSASESQSRSREEERRQSQFGRQNRTFSDQPAPPAPAVASGAQYRDGQPLATVASSPQSPTSSGSDSKLETEKENLPPKRETEDVSGSTDTNGTDSQLISNSKEQPPSLDQIPTHIPDENDGKPRRRMGGILGKLGGRKDGEDRGTGVDVSEIETAPTHGRKEHHFTPWSQVQNTIFNSPINILLIAAPVGIALHYATPDQAGAIFAVNFIAIIPLAALLSYATEEIALRTGETIGGLLNASFGNATELIVSIIALFQNQIIIVQTSLIGSMLSNLLLVMGMCFFFGGLNRPKQHFNITVAQTASSLLALALAGLIVPTVFDVQTKDSISLDITAISRGVSILLLLIYGCYLFFQLYTHVDIYNEPSKKEPKRKVSKGEASKGIASVGNLFGGIAPTEVHNNMMDSQGEDDEDEPKLHFWVAVGTLAVCTALIALNSEFMVDSIDQITEGPSGISKTFVGLILLPIVGNAAEHATAVTVACKDKMDLAIGVAVGSSMQIALLVLPLVVIIGWIAGYTAMNLDFDTFQVVILFISVLLVNYLIADGESHWLEGVQLMILYVIIALASWYYPQPCDSAAYYCPQTGSN